MSLPAFHCSIIRRDLTPEDCVKRQDLKNGSGARPPGYEPCDPTTCPTGRANREAVEQAAREEAGIPLSALDEDLDDILDAFDLTPTPTAKEPLPEPLPEAPTAPATEAPEPEPLVSPPATPAAPAAVSAAEPVPEPDRGKPGATPGTSDHTDEETMPDKTCKTKDCKNPVRFPNLGLCRACYERQRKEKLNGPTKRCKCGKTIRKDSAHDTCTACRGGKSAPVVKDPYEAPVTRKATPLKPSKKSVEAFATAGAEAGRLAAGLLDGDLGAFYEKLGDQHLAAHLRAAKSEVRKRIAGKDDLRTALEEA